MYDFINASFEFGLAFILYLNMRRLRIDRTIKGVSWYGTGFTSLWAVWNLLYYPYLEQWVSFVAGFGVLFMNSWWLYLAYQFRERD